MIGAQAVYRSCGPAPLLVTIYYLALTCNRMFSRLRTVNKWCSKVGLEVGERSNCDEAKGVTHGGAIGSENVGTSNRNASEILARRKNKVSFAMEIIEGLVGPKPMAIAAGDGHRVNIP